MSTLISTRKILIFLVFCALFTSTVSAATTGWDDPQWTGSTYNLWTNPDNAKADGGGVASDGVINNNQDYGGYNFSEIYGAIVNSVEVKIDEIIGDGDDSIEVSWTCDNFTWSTGYDVGVSGSPILRIDNLGEAGCSNPMSVANLSDNNFYIAILHKKGVPKINPITVDWIPVQVNYSLPVVGFTITLPGESPVDSEPAGNATTGIEFNNTGTAYSYSVVPCVKSAGGNCQTSTVPIFNFTNVGNVNLNYSVSINASLPSTISLYCDTDNDPAGNTTVTTSEWEVSSSVAQNAWVDLWCWADFLSVDASEDTQRRFYHNASS